jgi:hypothetical protein
MLPGRCRQLRYNTQHATPVALRLKGNFVRTNRIVTILAVPIMILALIAAGAGLFWQGSGEPYEYPTPRGDTAMIQGHGLYRYDTVSGAAQEQGNDFVTLVLGIPLLTTGVVLSRRDSMRGHLLLTGSLGFFLYTYASMAFLTAFNPLFLVYVALFSLSLFAFVLALSGLDPETVSAHVSTAFPRKTLIGYFLFVAAFLALAWLGLVATAMRTGQLPAGAEPNTTLVIQVLDLGVIVPTAAITAVLLWKSKPWGYTLATIMILKILTMGAALLSMIAQMWLAGVPLEPVTTTLFGVICVSGIILAVLTLRSIKAAKPAGE